MATTSAVTRFWHLANTVVKHMAYNRRSILNKSRFFHVVGGLPTDAMHDILEGVLHYEVKEMLKDFVKMHRLFTLEELNTRIAKFNLILGITMTRVNLCLLQNKNHHQMTTACLAFRILKPLYVQNGGHFL